MADRPDVNVTPTSLHSPAASTETAPASRAGAAVGTDFQAQLARAMEADGPVVAEGGDAAPADADVAAPPATPATSASSRAATAGTEPLTLGQMLHLYTLPPGTIQRELPPPSRAPSSAPVQGVGQVRGPAAAAGQSANGDDLGIGPVARPLPGAVGSKYGNRVHPVHGGVRMHHGADIGAPTGTPIHAFAAGTVTFAGPRGGYGNLVIVEHANGITSRYAHQSQNDVTVGQRVAVGEQVGRVGATGTATGPHLHFELRRDGESFDPGPWLP